MTRTYDVSSTFVHTIDADHGTAQEVLATHRPDALARRPPLGARPRRPRDLERDGELGYTLIWRFGGDQGHARLDWQIALEPRRAGRTALTVKARRPRERPGCPDPRAARLAPLRGARRRPTPPRWPAWSTTTRRMRPQPVAAPRLVAVGLGL